MMLNRTQILAAATTLMIGCGGGELSPDTPIPHGSSKAATVRAAARANNVSERSLMVAAFVQSNFGTEMSATGQIPGATRTTPFGLQGNATRGTVPQDLAANATNFAKAIREQARLTRPQQAFDWLVLTAHVIVGATEVTALSELQVRIVLNELVAAYNNGFTTILPSGEVITLPPAKHKITVDSLDRPRRNILEPASGGAEFGIAWNGNGDAEISEKYVTEMPKIILRWCPSSTLVCFDHLRYTTETPSHFMAFRSADGSLKFIQMHPLKKDLQWYGGTAPNAVSITMTGLVGEKPETLRPEAFDWGAATSLQRLTRSVLQSFASMLSPGALGKDPSVFVLEENGTTATLPDMTLAPEGSLKLALPKFWDTKFFADLMRIESLNPENQLQTIGGHGLRKFPNSRVSFSFKAGENASQLIFYSDMTPTENGGGIWELIRRSGIRADRPYPFEEEFSSPGAFGNSIRALRVVSQDSSGKPNGLSILRFQVKGLE